MLLTCFVVNKVILSHLIEKESKLPLEAKWIAIGDSHLTNAINPKNYPWIVNRAHSGERLHYNFEKIKYYVENNPQIELVILSFWNASLEYDMDWIIHGNDAVYRYESYMPLMMYNDTDITYLNVPDNKKLFFENYMGYKYGYPSPFVKTMVKNYFTSNHELAFSGGFLKAKGLYKRKEAKKALNDKSQEIKFDSLALRDIGNIVHYLGKKDVKLVLLNTPVTDEFLAPWNSQKLVKIDSIARSYENKQTVWYINHSKKEFIDGYFNDLHHLNYRGANIYTPIVVDTIFSVLQKSNIEFN